LVNLILSYQITRCRVHVIDLILMPFYKRIEYIPIANPEFIPLCHNSYIEILDRTNYRWYDTFE
jgi:hypothetical protein